MQLIPPVELLRQKPFVDAEHPARFQYAGDLGVDPQERGGVDGGFGGVDEVEG